MRKSYDSIIFNFCNMKYEESEENYDLSDQKNDLIILVIMLNVKKNETTKRKAMKTEM